MTATSADADRDRGADATAEAACRGRPPQPIAAPPTPSAAADASRPTTEYSVAFSPRNVAVGFGDRRRAGPASPSAAGAVADRGRADADARRAAGRRARVPRRGLRGPRRLDADAPITPIAGGTDLMVRLTGEIGEPPARMLDLWRLDELRGIARRRRRDRRSAR